MSKNLSDIFPPTEIGGGGGGGIEEAPKTGKMYARKDEAWAEFATGNLDDGNKDGEILTWDTGSANWTHDDTLIVKGGRVGIGINDPQNSLHLKTAIQVESPAGNSAWIDKQDAALIVHAGNGSELDLRGDTFKLGTPNGDSRLTINSAGRTSLFASNEKYGLQLNKTDVTDGPFLGSDGEDVFVVSTHGGLERFRLEANGDATFSGTVNSHSSVWNNNGGLSCDGNKRILPYNADGQPEDGTYNLGRDTTGGVGAYRFKDAHFSGTVNANNIKGEGDRAGFLFDGAKRIIPTENGSASNGKQDLGSTANKFKDAYFNGTVDASAFTVNGVPIGGGSGGLPDGGYTYGWSITATDFIATSDERLKDNITTAPVGLIDSLKGREWDWSESGEKGSGVVAQELEQVLPHLVHEDEEGMKSVAYNGLIAYLIEELKDCRQRIAELEAKA